MKTPQSPYRPHVESLEERCLLAADPVLVWNAHLLEAEANDFDPKVIADQPGPVRTARAFAIVQAAVYDAVDSIEPLYTPYLAFVPNARGASIPAAVATASHDTLVAMFPDQQDRIDQQFTDYLATIPPSLAKIRGIVVGRQAAANILADRANDGSQEAQSYVFIPYPGYHQPDPDHPNQGVLDPQWGEVRPFVLGSSNQFRAPDVGLDPASRLAFLNSQEYTDAYNEVRFLGEKNSTVRTPEQTEIGIFWGYDGVPGLGTPPRAFNQITEIIATLEHNTVLQNARLFALVNLAMADGGIACWESKYFYNFWRPIVGIRNADETGNPNTPADPDWEPLGAQADNGSLIGSNFTPPFPSYDSGHATFGAALFQTIRDFYGTDDIAFDWMSDEFNGVTRDADGNVRPVVVRHYDNLTEPQVENHDSRIYLGVHWRFDQDAGDAMGTSIANYVFSHILQRRGRGADGSGGDDSGDLSALAIGATPTTPVVGVVSPGGLRLASLQAVPNAAGQNLLVLPAASPSAGTTSSVATLTHSAGDGSPALTPADAIDLSMSLPGLFS